MTAEAQLPMGNRLSVIIPTRDEELSIAHTVSAALALSAPSSPPPEVIVVDGGSSDRTADVARAAGARILVVDGAGRASRLNAGARAAKGTTFLFLHADSRPPCEYARHIVETLAVPGTVAGAFRLKIDSTLTGIPAVEFLANVRAAVFQLPYGDQGLFLTKKVFNSVGGYPDMPFMDDYAMSRKLSRIGQIRVAPSHVVTSGRRWATLGVLPTTIVNQLIIIGYNIGIPVHKLRAWYYGIFLRAAARNKGIALLAQQRSSLASRHFLCFRFRNFPVLD